MMFRGTTVLYRRNEPTTTIEWVVQMYLFQHLSSIIHVSFLVLLFNLETFLPSRNWTVVGYLKGMEDVNVHTNFTTKLSEMHRTN